MAIWLNSEQLAWAMKRSLSTAKDAIKAESYKGKPLVVRQEKITLGKGRPSYLVLWDTDTNQPATQAELTTTGDLHEERTQEISKNNPVAGIDRDKHIDSQITRDEAQENTSPQHKSECESRDEAQRYGARADCIIRAAVDYKSSVSHQPTTGEHHAQSSSRNQNQADMADTERFLATTGTQGSKSMGHQKTDQSRPEIQSVSFSRGTGEISDIGRQYAAEMPSTSTLAIITQTTGKPHAQRTTTPAGIAEYGASIRTATGADEGDFELLSKSPDVLYGSRGSSRSVEKEVLLTGNTPNAQPLFRDAGSQSGDCASRAVVSNASVLEQPNQGNHKADKSAPTTTGNTDEYKRNNPATPVNETVETPENRVSAVCQKPHHRRHEVAGDVNATVNATVDDDNQGNHKGLPLQDTGKPIHLSCALLALAEKSALSGERQAVDVLQNTVQLGTLNEASPNHLIQEENNNGKNSDTKITGPDRQDQAGIETVEDHLGATENSAQRASVISQAQDNYPGTGKGCIDRSDLGGHVRHINQTETTGNPHAKPTDTPTDRPGILHPAISALLSDARHAQSVATGAENGVGRNTLHEKSTDLPNGVDAETGEVLYTGSFTCQVDYIERLITQKGLVKQCKSTMLSRYFASIVPSAELKNEWQALTNNVQKKKFAKQHQLIGIVPDRLLTKEPKKLRGRKSLVPDKIVAFIGYELIQRTDPTNLAKFTPVRERNAERIIEWVKTEFKHELSAAQVRSVISKNNWDCFLEPIAEEQKGGGKQQTGSWPRLPVCELWLMDGVVPSKMYIRDAKGTGWTHITCIGIEDVGSRLMLGFKEYYSESGAASVHLFKEVFTRNTFKRGTSEKAISPTLRPDQGSGFVSSMDGCAFAIGELYAQKHHFLIDYKPAKAGTPTDKAHLESSWKFVHGKYINMVREVFGVRIVNLTPVKNHKVGKTVYATYFDISLEELRASGIAEQFRNDINSKRRNFKEDNADIKFKPIDRWQRFLCGASDDDLIMSPLEGTTFTGSAEELIKLDIFGYPKLTGYSVRHQAGGFIVTYKTRKYVVQAGHSFSKVHSTEVRISVLPSGELALFTEKEKSDLGAEFLCLATLGTVGATGDNAEKYHAARQRKDDKLSNTITKITQASLEDLMLAEFEKHAITPFQPTVKKLIEQGLSLELMQSIITSNAALSQPNDGSEISKTSRFKRFQLEALRALQSTTSTATVKRGVN